ncbi:MAG: endonuclease/exonuclease/phosphatase family protein [Cyclobacteriaceae bacterium]
MRVLQVSAFVVALLPVPVFIIPTDIHFIDVVQSFALHAVVGYALMAFILFARQKRQWAMPFFLASFSLLLYLLPYFTASPTQDYEFEGKAFRVAHFNVLDSNILYDQLAEQAQATDADLISFREVDSTWMDELILRLRNQYPHHHLAHQEAHGVAIFSKHPVQDLTTYYWGDVPNLTGNILFSDTTVHFVATHTLSPRGEDHYTKRNRHLRQMARYLESIDGLVLAIGDFNAVPWNPHIMQIRRQSSLFDSRQSGAPTYPTDWKIGSISIDYILHSDELQCLDFHSVDTGGFDHRGVFEEYQFIIKEI